MRGNSHVRFLGGVGWAKPFHPNSVYLELNMKSVFLARPVRIRANSRDCFEVRSLPWPFPQPEPYGILKRLTSWKRSYLTRSVWLFPAVVAFSNLSRCPKKKEGGNAWIKLSRSLLICLWRLWSWVWSISASAGQRLEPESNVAIKGEALPERGKEEWGCGLLSLDAEPDKVQQAQLID